MQHLNIDLETYSSVDLLKCGMYKYVQSPDFEIMLFAYSLDGAPVKVIDLAIGEILPSPILDLLQNPNIIKHAYNAAFEWYCLNKFYYSPLEQWQCTMLHALYCGYPMGLANVGNAIGLPSDKRKMGIGKALIRTFCIPQKPTKSNGNRTRTLPHHEPEKWVLFKEYCRQDVVTEMSVEDRLINFPVPQQEQALWQLDQRINSFGAAVDLELIEGALHCSKQTTEELMAEAIKLSGLDNPKSVTQLKAWLEKEMDEELTTLNKEDVKGLIKTVDDEKVKRVLELRQEFSKTSVMKYAAMDNAVCSDGRVRGLLQFYGANRTGRWCLTGDHEILTPKGWTRLDEWEGGEIACWSPKTEFISFQKSKPLEFDYTGELYHIESKRCSQLSTPDHKMPYWGKNGNWEADTVQTLSSKRFSIPFTGRHVTNSSLEHTELRILIMTQADGHYTRDGDLRFHFSKQRKIERCKSLLRKSGIVFTVFDRDKSIAITIKSRNLPVWLRMFRNKVFDMWLVDENADIIFDELENWDGYRCGPNSIQYTTIIKQNADVIQAAAHLSGRAATIIEKHRNNENWSVAYVVNIWLTPLGRNEIKEKPQKIAYSGKVYCAETETGFFMVRRNGKVWVTGNSGRLVQVQNLPRNYLETLSFARDLIKGKKVQQIKAIYGNVPDTLSQLIRTAFIPSKGNSLVVADFSAIEARIIAWLAGEQWRLDVFATHGKIYEASASQMFGVPLEKISKGNPEYELRAKGKVAELALGYQGAAGALITMGALDMGILETDLPDIVRRWRDANKRIVDLWYALDSTALQVVKTGQATGVKGILFAREIDYANGQDFLTVTLPSGRKLYYAKPTLSPNQWGRESISYMGMNQETKKWGSIPTYGGKLTENCLAGDTLVLTNRGWVFIKDVELTDLVWDGDNWVKHEGVISKGGQDTIALNGVGITLEHLVFTERGWVSASSCEGLNWKEVKLPNSNILRRFKRKEITLEHRVRLRKNDCISRYGVSKGKNKVLRLQEIRADWTSKFYTRNVKSPGLCSLALNDRPMQTSYTSSVGELRGQRHNSLRTLARRFCGVLGGYGSNIRKRAFNRQNKCKRWILSRELSLGKYENTSKEQARKYISKYTLGPSYYVRGCRKVGNKRNYFALQKYSRLPRRTFVCSPGRNEQVYDIVNCGENHRFTVLGKQGAFIVHNCVQAIARDCLAETLFRVENAGYKTAFHVHDEVVIDVPENEADLDRVCDLMAQPIPWAPGLLLKGAGFVTKFYMKD